MRETLLDRWARADSSSAHLPKVTDMVAVSDDDLRAMKAAFVKGSNEVLPKTETLIAVACIGYRMAMRDAAGPMPNPTPEEAR